MERYEAVYGLWLARVHAAKKSWLNLEMKGIARNSGKKVMGNTLEGHNEMWATMNRKRSLMRSEPKKRNMENSEMIAKWTEC